MPTGVTEKPNLKLTSRELLESNEFRTIAFIAGFVGSMMTVEARAESLFDDEKLRVYLGVGAE